MRLYFYDSTTTPQFSGPYDVGTTSARNVTTPRGVTYDVLLRADPVEGFYEAILASNPPPDEYYRADDPPVSLTFDGIEGTDEARVQETNVWVSLSLEEIYNLKSQDIADKDRAVRYNAVDTSLSTNWWMVVTQNARNELALIAIADNKRAINSQAFPGGPNAPWVSIYNAATTAVRRYQVNETQWDTLLDEWVQHDQATGNATQASGDALDTAYDNGNGNRADVVAHDPNNPSWGYPPTVNIDSRALSLL